MERKQMEISERLQGKIRRQAMARRLRTLSGTVEGDAGPSEREEKEDVYGDGNADDPVPHR